MDDDRPFYRTRGRCVDETLPLPNPLYQQDLFSHVEPA